MTESADKIFIAVRSGIESGLDQLREFVHWVTPALGLESISSIYQIQFVDTDWRSQGDERQGLIACFAGPSDLSPPELLGFLQEIEVRMAKAAAHKKITVYLLAYDSKVAMSKALNLPYSEWHKNPALLLPAAEICPEYVHPVLHRTLGDLAAGYVEDQWGKFYAQGKSLFSGHPGE